MNPARIWFLCLGWIAHAFIVTTHGAEPALEFSRDIRPLLAQHCIACHGPDESKRKAGLRLDTREGATAWRKVRAAIVPGDRRRSELWRRVTATDPDDRMPPVDAEHALTAEEIERLGRWIEQGAEYARHWAWSKPIRPELPPLSRRSWAWHPIDRFIFARLESRDLEPSREADLATLARRVSLDLTGLPPSLDEVDALVRDPDPGGYERWVDRLLHSPHYGEHWARMWLDLARFADSAGYGSDPLRPMWRYRDWVIGAYNRNMPFDQFTVEQLAGDLLPDANSSQLLATAFHRNTKTNTEGGTDDEEFRVEAVKDRTDTTMQVWMGLTWGCAKCHTHKYDPITQRDYYALFDFFNQTEDADAPDYSPKILTPTEPQAARLAELEAARAKQESLWQAKTPEREAAQDAWEAGILEAVRAQPARLGPWHTVGPFPAKDIFGAFGTAFEPEKEKGPVVLDRVYLDGQLKWQLRSEWTDGVVHDLPSQVGATYLYRTLSLDVAQEVTFSFGSNDGITVWVNREQKLARRIGREAAPDQEKLVLVLPPGEHAVLIRISNFGGSAGFYFRLARAGLPELAEAGLARPSGARTAEQRRAMDRYYEVVAPELRPLREAYAQALADKTAYEATVPKTPIMRERPRPQRRATHVLRLANFLMPGELVTAATPASMHAWPAGAATNRLGLARWLVSPENPLTARVQVNRWWAQLFGRGLVETEEDFGTKGAEPSHPELLDWLACELMESGWDMRHVLRLMVTSATYRQSATSSPRLREQDPENRWYARGPRLRLPAEAVRDQALALSGLLARVVGGASVFPPQPEGLWQAAFNGDRTWATSVGPDRYRRGLYTFLRRTTPYPSMATFDAPSRESCTIRRRPTNTPLQAFVTLNDPVFVEAAHALGARVWREGGTSTEGRLDYGLRLALLRSGGSQQLTPLMRLLASELEHYRAHPDEAERVAAQGPGAWPAEVPMAERAAWTIVGSVLLNLDAVMMKG